MTADKPDIVARLNAALEGRYTIERELGEGGMATVYLADDVKHNRKVALKRGGRGSAAGVWSSPGKGRNHYLDLLRFGSRPIV